ncbi:TolC family protein [Hyalangium versicolor]|uniref:TolC family protein n=1 Tax=Hyalangium versicolor TaxID=2861190 RepID=UPI001CCD178F|nr:TolC family protein [Hyalangium versicolor]
MHPAIIALLLALNSAGPAQAGDTLRLETALAEAAAREPGLAGAQAQAEIAQAEVESARTLPPLTVAVGAGWNDPHWSVGLAQKLPVPGARAARVSAAEQGGLSATHELHAHQARARADARRAYFSLVRARQLAAAGERTLELARASEEAARLRFETGAGPEMELVQARLARASTEAQVLALRGEVAATSAELAVLLGREPHRLLEPTDIDAPPLPSLEQILTRAEQAPQALARERDIAAAEATLRAVRRERWPSPTVGIATEGEGAHGANVFLRGSIDFDVQVPGFGRGELDRAAAALRLAKAQAEEEHQRRRMEIIAAHERLSSALAALQRFPQEILPSVELLERMAIDAYRAGRTPLSALNDARRTATETRNQAAEAAFTAQTAFAALELAAGVPLDEN